MFRLSYDNVDGFLRGIWKGSVAGDAYASIPSELLRKNPCNRSLGRISIVNFHREISASEYRFSTPIRWIFFENIMNFYSADNLGGHWISLRIISLGGGFIGSNLPGKFLPFSFVISLLSAIEKWSIDLSAFNTWIRLGTKLRWIGRGKSWNSRLIKSFRARGKIGRENGRARGLFEAYRGCVEAEVTPKAGKHIMTSIAGWRYILRRLQAAPESSVRPVIAVSQKVHGKRLLLRHASLPRVETLN